MPRDKKVVSILDYKIHRQRREEEQKTKDHREKIYKSFVKFHVPLNN